MSPRLSRQDILRRIAGLIARHSGLVFGPDKDYLLTSRLRAVARERGYSTIDDLYREVIAPRGDDDIVERLVEAVIIGETSFFRDPPTFEFLARELTRWWDGNAFPSSTRHSLRIWSAACATGQEPYSIAVQICRAVSQLARRTTILATDISRPFLERARLGRYRLSSLRGTGREALGNFARCRDDRVEILDTVKHMTSFRQHNLLDSYLPLGAFDVIFCRNVLIYFSEETRADVLRRLGQALEPGGLLFLGLTECILDFEPPLEKVIQGNAVAFRRMGGGRARRSR